jgi:hypothetical protein
MRERKYIRFDFAQALHTRATRAERRDYRIIARTRTSDHSLTRALARPFTPLQRRTPSCAKLLRNSRCKVAWFLIFPYIAPVSETLGCSCRSNSSRSWKALTRARQREKQRHWPRRAYQIETARMRIAIEFFLVDSMRFLSLRRCDHRLPRASCAENQVIRRA